MWLRVSQVGESPSDAAPAFVYRGSVRMPLAAPSAGSVLLGSQRRMRSLQFSLTVR